MGFVKGGGGNESTVLKLVSVPFVPEWLRLCEVQNEPEPVVLITLNALLLVQRVVIQW